MKIGLMADSHDRLPAIVEFLRQMRDAGATMVLHAGDYISPLSLKPFEDVHMTLQGVFGRNDGDPQGLLARAGAGLSLSLGMDLETRVDPSIIGGAVARIGSTVYDGSVTTQLQKVKERLTAAAAE